jgi:zinc D-Ala-D-Ala carboxypeptidase
MFKAAANDGVDLKVVSAYRSFAEQSSLKSTYTMVYGTGANQFSADQGYSEHQLGTTVDLTMPEIGSTFTGFDQSKAFAWLAKNAYKYGFILSYPKNNTYYQYEPWHWRFVGRDLARYLHNQGKNFYDLDQRVIDEYKVSFFD